MLLLFVCLFFHTTPRRSSTKSLGLERLPATSFKRFSGMDHLLAHPWNTISILKDRSDLRGVEIPAKLT